MRIHYQSLITTLFCVFTLSAQAASSFYCANTGRYVNTGVNEQQVIEQCGQPLEKQEGSQAVTETKEIEHWFYDFQLRFSLIKGVFTLENRRVTAIRLDDTDVTSTDICPRGIVRIGSTDSNLNAHCGRPILKNKSQQSVDKGEKDVVIWTYKANEFQPATYFKFENGILVDIINP